MAQVEVQDEVVDKEMDRMAEDQEVQAEIIIIEEDKVDQVVDTDQDNLDLEVDTEMIQALQKMMDMKPDAFIMSDP